MLWLYLNKHSIDEWLTSLYKLYYILFIVRWQSFWTSARIAAMILVFVDMHDLSLRDSSWFSMRSLINSDRHRRTIFTLEHYSPYTEIIWRWIFIALSFFAITNWISHIIHRRMFLLPFICSPNKLVEILIFW